MCAKVSAAGGAGAFFNGGMFVCPVPLFPVRYGRCIWWLFLPFSRRTKDCDATGERTHEKEKSTMERRMGENGLPLPLLPLFFGES